MILGAMKIGRRKSKLQKQMAIREICNQTNHGFDYIFIFFNFRCNFKIITSFVKISSITVHEIIVMTDGQADSKWSLSNRYLPFDRTKVSVISEHYRLTWLTMIKILWQRYFVTQIFIFRINQHVWPTLFLLM